MITNGHLLINPTTTREIINAARWHYNYSGNDRVTEQADNFAYRLESTKFSAKEIGEMIETEKEAFNERFYEEYKITNEIDIQELTEAVNHSFARFISPTLATSRMGEEEKRFFETFTFFIV